MTEQVRAAGYVRVSTAEQAEEGHSIYEQPRLIEEFVADHDGWDLIEVFSDPGWSGSREDRPGLQGMLSRLDEIDVVIVWAMDRLTRDVELFAKLVKLFTAANVRVESLTAHVDLATPEGKAMANVSAAFGQFERERIAERVRAALKARKMKGGHNGGPPPDGWMDDEVGRRDDGRPLYQRVHDPERAPVIRHLFDLAEKGLPDAALARHLNAEGYRTRARRPWDRRSIQNHVTNAWHAGRVVLHRGKPDEEVFDGHHDPLVDPPTFDRIQTNREKRDKGAGSHEKGRPAHRHLLAKLVRCGACGAPMFAVTSSYERKDGTRARQYACRGYKFSDGTCDVKVDAEVIDTTVLETLPKLMPRFNEWIEQIEDRHAAERDRLQVAADTARNERDDLAERLSKAEDRFIDADDEDQERMRSALDRRRDELKQAEVRAQATADALASVPQDASYDRLLDFASSLRAVIAGRLDGDHTVKELNLALTEWFEMFEVYPEPTEGITPGDPEDALRPGPCWVFPYLRLEVVRALLDEGEDDETPAPPMEWIEALAKSADSQE